MEDHPIIIITYIHGDSYDDDDQVRSGRVRSGQVRSGDCHSCLAIGALKYPPPLPSVLSHLYARPLPILLSHWSHPSLSSSVANLYLTVPPPNCASLCEPCGDDNGDYFLSFDIRQLLHRHQTLEILS